MMRLMLHHGPEPLPDGNGRAGGSLTFALQVRVAQSADDAFGLYVESVKVQQHGVVTIRQLAPTTRIAAGAPGDGLGVHIALDGGQMPHQVTEREGAGAMTPFQPVGRNAGCHSPRPATQAFPVLQELCYRSDFHLTYILLMPNDSGISRPPLPLATGRLDALVMPSGFLP